MERSKLKSEFPRLYKKLTKFEVGDGWIPLIWKMSKQLEEEIKNNPNERDMYAVQVKSKYGVLNYYMSYSTDKMKNIIHEAENASSGICEFCGNRGLTREEYTACEEHKEINN